MRQECYHIIIFPERTWHWHQERKGQVKTIVNGRLKRHPLNGLSKSTKITSNLKNTVLPCNRKTSKLSLKASTARSQRSRRRRIPSASPCVNFDISWLTSILHDAYFQLSFYRPLCYYNRPHCPLHTTITILAGAHSYFVVSSFTCEGKNMLPWLNTQPSVQ